MQTWGRIVGAWLVALLCGCATSRDAGPRRTSLVEVGQKVGLEKLRYAFEAKSPFVVALIPEFHHLPGCQAEVYATLEALHPMTSFVAVEGRIGEVRHDELFGGFVADKPAPKDYAGLTARPLSERRAQVDVWRDTEFPRAAGFGTPLHAAILYEAVYQDRVRSQGLERTEVYTRANRIAMRYERQGIVRAVPKGTIVGARDRVFVQKLRHYGQYMSTEGHDVVPFPVGAAHVGDLARRLRRARVSHVVLVNRSCTIARRRVAKR